MKTKNNVTILAPVFMILAVCLAFYITYFRSDTESSTRVEKTYETSLFDKTKVQSIEIIMAESSWNDMLENATKEEFYACDVIVNGVTYKNVGIRPKGNTSLTMVASSSTTDRYSFKIDFGKYIDGQTCDGLDVLLLNNMMSDATYMKEYLSYDLFQFMDVNSSLTAFMDVKVNGKDWGLYFGIEGMEESFAQRNYGYSHGKLYKVETMSMGGGGGFDKGNFDKNNFDRGNFEKGNFDRNGFNDKNGFPNRESESNIPRTEWNVNESEASNIKANLNATQSELNANKSEVSVTQSELSTTESKESDIKSQINTTEKEQSSNKERIENRDMKMSGFGSGSGANLAYTDDNAENYSAIFNNATFDIDNADEKAVIEALKNINNGTELEKYVDVDQMLRYIAVNVVVVNLDSYFGTMLHNYYLYEENGQLSMLPWDYNLAFAGFQSGNANSAINLAIDTVVSGASLEDRPMIAKLLEVEEYKEKYHEYLQQIVTGYFNSGYFVNKIQYLDTLISSYVQKDATAFYNYEQYKTGVDTLMQFGLLRSQSIEGQLNGTIPSTQEEQKKDSSNLVDASSLNLSSM